MEHLEQQKKAIDLGKLLVKELGLESSNDTLSRWMAHYISEKIILAERLPKKQEKNDAKKDCFETILKLWKHRWLLPSGKRPLQNFAPILEVLNKLNPERPDLFYINIGRYVSELEINTDKSKEKKIDVDAALQIDKVARMLIDDILHEAALVAKGESTAEYLKNAIDVSDDNDTKIIQILFEDESTAESEKFKEHSFNQNYKIERLKKRVEDLEKFRAMNEQLIDRYKKQLLSMQEKL
jgi:hypothetical protein